MYWTTAQFLLAALAVTACASPSDTPVVATGLPNSDSFRIQRSQMADYDYLVTIRNGADLGINADDQGARDRMALLALKNQCEAPQIIKEIVVNGGSQLLGGANRTYQLQVKC